jgi:hypothetical protein
LLQRLLGRYGDEGVQAAVEFRYPFKKMTSQLFRGELALLQPLGRISQSEVSIDHFSLNLRSFAAATVAASFSCRISWKLS